MTETLSDKIYGNPKALDEPVCKSKAVKQFIKDDTTIIIDFVNGSISQNEMWMRRIKLAGEKLTK